MAWTSAAALASRRGPEDLRNELDPEVYPIVPAPDRGTIVILRKTRPIVAFRSREVEERKLHSLDLEK
jgi:hypothetical protein